MKKVITFICTMAAIGAIVSAQTRVDLRTQSKTVDFTQATTTKPFKSGTSLPAVCSVGETFFKSDAPAGQNFYACTAANAWTAQAGGGGGGATQAAQLGDLAASISNGTQVNVAAGVYRIGNQTYSIAATSFSIQSLTISSIAVVGATTTVALQTPSAYRPGDLINIQGAAGCTGLNGLWLATGIDPQHFNIPFNSSGCTYTGGSGLASANSNATGTAVIYGDPNGIVILEHPAGAGFSIACSGPCAVRQTAAPTFATGGIPLANVIIQGTGWAAVSDKRAFLSNRAFIDGPGIASTEFGGIRAIAVDSTVARTTIANAWSGDNDFSASPSLTVTRGLGAPSSGACTGAAQVGRLYQRADAKAVNSSLYLCSQTSNAGFGWELAQAGPFLSSPADGGLKFSSTAQPACDAAHRGTVFYLAGGSGVKDTFQVCAKDAGDAFAWRTIY